MSLFEFPASKISCQSRNKKNCRIAYKQCSRGSLWLITNICSFAQRVTAIALINFSICSIPQSTYSLMETDYAITILFLSDLILNNKVAYV